MLLLCRKEVVDNINTTLKSPENKKFTFFIHDFLNNFKQKSFETNKSFPIGQKKPDGLDNLNFDREVKFEPQQFE